MLTVYTSCNSNIALPDIQLCSKQNFTKLYKINIDDMTIDLPLSDGMIEWWQ